VPEAEEFSLLGAVARERLVKIAGWKTLSGCCGDLRIVEISGGTVMLVFPSGVNKSNIQSIPRL
jgi:hypothetical protein